MIKSMKGGRHSASSNSQMTVDEIRLIADLRIMHSKVDELYQISKVLQTRHNENAVINCADARVLAEDIRKADELYLWFIRLKEESDRARKRAAAR
ncbi:MAG TPA: hypothetical protein VLA96_01025 [Terriglobales bacterium]|jgi:hypothetical protein|nr:hypothetical protein [Terriglobales bacterium]